MSGMSGGQMAKYDQIQAYSDVPGGLKQGSGRPGSQAGGPREARQARRSRRPCGTVPGHHVAPCMYPCGTHPVRHHPAPWYTDEHATLGRHVYLRQCVNDSSWHARTNAGCRNLRTVILLQGQYYQGQYYQGQCLTKASV